MGTDATSLGALLPASSATDGTRLEAALHCNLVLVLQPGGCIGLDESPFSERVSSLTCVMSHDVCSMFRMQHAVWSQDVAGAPDSALRAILADRFSAQTSSPVIVYFVVG